jgi:hypothetical protein
MEADLFKTLRQVTGIGRIALGVALPLLRDVINSHLALRLGRVQAIRLLRLLTVLVWSMGVIGVPLWAIPTDRGATQLVARAGVGSAGQIERSRIEIRDVPGRGLPPRERNSTRTHIHVESGINGSAVIINAPPHSEASVSVIMSVSGRLLAIACRALTPAIIGLIMGITPAATRAGVLSRQP